MPSPKIAVAVFVKTPGLSPVKTRLASPLGHAFAEEFYERCLACIEEVCREAVERSAGMLKVYWAVAEAEATANHRWQAFPVVRQGVGGLGERLDKVYAALLAEHAGVVLVGADIPQLSPNILCRAGEMLRKEDFVIGRSEDGGFYLFGGRRELASSAWTGVTYSVETTAEELLAGLNQKPLELPRTFDVDTVDELIRLEEVLRRDRASVLPAQKVLSRFLTEHLPTIRAAR